LSFFQSRRKAFKFYI